jgi:hypothetical protein
MKTVETNTRRHNPQTKTESVVLLAQPAPLKTKDMRRRPDSFC